MPWPLLLWLHACCWAYQVDPQFAYNVARVESGTSTQTIRLGRLGNSPFYGPGGIRGRWVRGLDMENPYSNVLVMTRALRGKDKRQVLKRYNPQATDAYLAAVLGRNK